MAPRRKARQARRTTLLVVGEGPDDQAFIKHINRLFHKQRADVKATIQKESGGSPGNIITNTTRKYKNDGFSKRCLKTNHTEPEAYEDLFTQSVLENTGNESVIRVRDILLGKE